MSLLIACVTASLGIHGTNLSLILNFPLLNNGNEPIFCHHKIQNNGFIFFVTFFCHIVQALQHGVTRAHEDGCCVAAHAQAM
jgi:hypothetical protein